MFSCLHFPSARTNNLKKTSDIAPNRNDHLYVDFVRYVWSEQIPKVKAERLTSKARDNVRHAEGMCPRKASVLLCDFRWFHGGIHECSEATDRDH